MSWKAWLAAGRLGTLQPDRNDLAALRRAAERSLADAVVEGLSPEGRFQLAYGAALDLAAIAVLASGYRVRARAGHHQLTFQAARLALGDSASRAIELFEFCRLRRNVIAYEGSEVGDELAHELIQETESFLRLVDDWMRRRRPGLL